MNYSSVTLVVHVGGIGDFLLCCPALLKLSSAGPLELLGNPDRLGLGLVAGAARAVHDINHVGFESVFHEPGDRFREFIRSFGRAVIWMSDKTGLIKKGFRRCGLKNIKVFPGLPPPAWKDHASAYYLGCLGFGKAPPLRLPVEPVTPCYDVVIHPGSGGKSKTWPADRYLDLARRLKQGNRLVTWCLGPAEEAFSRPEDDSSIRLESLQELSRILGSAYLYIGNDSGITHLAAAAGCRTLAIFGPTDPLVWAPLGQHVTILKGEPWPEPEEVMEVITDLNTKT